MGIAPSHFERDLVLNDPSEEREEEEQQQKDRTERAKQRAMMHTIGFEEDIPGDLECSICAEVSELFFVSAFCFFFSEDARARARSRRNREREERRGGVVCGVSREDAQNMSCIFSESLRAFMITNTLL